MRGLAHNFYALTLRAQALVGLLLVGWLFSNVPAAVARDQYIGTPLSVAVIACVVSLALLWPYLTPSWIGRPVRLNQVIPLLLAHAALPLMYGFVAMSAIVAADIAQPLDRQLAITVAAFLIGTAVMAWALGTALCFWARPPRPVAKDNVSVLVPVTEVAEPLHAVARDADEVEFRSLRRPRLSQAS